MSDSVLDAINTYLDVNFAKQYNEAIAFLKLPIPNIKDSNGKVFASQNLQLQNEIDNSKAQISFLISFKKSTLFKEKQSLYSNAKDEGFKTAGEREAYCYSDAKYSELDKEYTALQILHDRLSSIQWFLKNQYDCIR